MKTILFYTILQEGMNENILMKIIPVYYYMKIFFCMLMKIFFYFNEKGLFFVNENILL